MPPIRPKARATVKALQIRAFLYFACATLPRSSQLSHLRWDSSSPLSHSRPNSAPTMGNNLNGRFLLHARATIFEHFKDGKRMGRYRLIEYAMGRRSKRTTARCQWLPEASMVGVGPAAGKTFTAIDTYVLYGQNAPSGTYVLLYDVPRYH